MSEDPEKTGGGGGAFHIGSIGNVYGDMVTGGQTKINLNSSQTESRNAIADIAQAVDRAPPEVKNDASGKLTDLKAEIGKGKKSDDGAMSRLIKGLVDLVPGATQAVVSAFGTPLLGAIAGPLTKKVIKEIEGHMSGGQPDQESPDEPQTV
ncbi:hypothetical protein ABIE89_007371 [Bradyrhizobium niftali]|uniref:hypothetical protein n=1 Tax=Bradyrhizobium niftali TaxID=2560055 RepID=UPI0038363FC7